MIDCEWAKREIAIFFYQRIIHKGIFWVQLNFLPQVCKQITSFRVSQKTNRFIGAPFRYVDGRYENLPLQLLAAFVCWTAAADRSQISSRRTVTRFGIANVCTRPFRITEQRALPLWKALTMAVLKTWRSLALRKHHYPNENQNVPRCLSTRSPGMWLKRTISVGGSGRTHRNTPRTF